MLSFSSSLFQYQTLKLDEVVKMRGALIFFFTIFISITFCNTISYNKNEAVLQKVARNESKISEDCLENFLKISKNNLTMNQGELSYHIHTILSSVSRKQNKAIVFRFKLKVKLSFICE